MSDPVVEISSGKLRGVNVDGVCRFLGIPYAAAPDGANRFKPVGAPQPWSGVRDASDYGPSCPQGTVDLDPEIIALAGTQDRTPVHDEAGCLVLNVWTPDLSRTAKRPVMVWLHGGGYMVGSSTPNLYDGARIARKGDTVIVSLNHRLNAFGHLYLGQIGGEDYADSGNLALLDIVTALRWVQQNIEQFGGDPGNVTIFGVSGGGAKVAMLMCMPAAKGLFHKAIVQSGGGFWPKAPEQATRTASAILKELGISERSLGDIHRIPAERIVQATTKVMGALLAGGSTQGNMGPVLDGRSLHQHPFIPQAPALSADVPLIIGTNRHEATMVLSANPALFSLDAATMSKAAAMFVGGDPAAAQPLIDAYLATDPGQSPSDVFMELASDRLFRMTAIAFAESRGRQSQAPTYMYLFTWETTAWNGRLRATHALEIPFVFDTVDRMPMTGTSPERQPLATAVSDAWLAFARTGNPNHSGLPNWRPYDTSERATMIFDKQVREQLDPGSQVRAATQALPLFEL